MSILQISKIQQRAGNLVDLPQLDDAEFGWASDSKRLFIGKTSPNENVEVLTSYSNINYSQITGSYGNLNINPVTIAAGEVLTFDGTNWVNSGGNAGGQINLGNVSNVTINGGAIGYVLQTDGLGNLSWTPKGTLISFIENVSKASIAVVTTTSNHNLTEGATITITGAQGMTQLNGNKYYANVISSNTFSLYSDSGLTTPINSSTYNAYAYTSVTATTTGTNYVTVGNSAVLTTNQPVQFIGSLSTSGILNNTTYYINAIPNGTSISISNTVYANGTAGPVMSLQSTSGLTANVYETGGQLVSLVSGGSGGGSAGGTNTQVQFNNTNLLGGSSSFTFDYANNILTVGGNANVGNLNATAQVSAVTFASNVANGTAPMTINSSTKVANLNADLVDGYNTSIAVSANTIVVRDSNGNVSGNAILGNTLNITGNANVGNIGATTGTFTTVSGNGATISSITGANVTGSVANATYAVNASTAATVTTNAQPNITSVGNLTSLSVTGNTSTGNITAIGNITAAYFVGNGSQLTGLTVSAGSSILNGNSNVVVSANGNITISSAGVSNVVIATGTGVNVNGYVNSTGNMTGANVIGNHFGNGSGLSAITGSNVTGTVANATYATNAGTATTSTTAITSTTAGTVTTAAQPNITTVGNLTSLSVTGNIVAGNIGVTNTLSANVIASNLFTGNGSGLSNINGSNVGVVANATYAVSAGTATISGTVTTAAQPNITSVGQLISLSVAGNINGANIIGSLFGNGISISSITGANVTGTVANATYAVSAGTATSATTAGTVTANAQPNITTVGTLTGLNSGPAVFTTSGSPAIDALTPNNGTTGGLRIRGNATANLGYIQFTDSTATNQWSYLSVNTTGYMTYSSTLNPSILQTSTITTGANVNAGTITGSWTLSAGSTLVSTTTGTVTTASQPNITSVGTLTSLSVSGLSALTGGIAAIGASPSVNSQGAWIGWNQSGGGGETNFVNQAGSGSPAGWNWQNSTNTNIRTTVATLTASGNLTTSGQFNGSGAGLTSIPGANVTGTVANATYAISTGTSATFTSTSQNSQFNSIGVGTAGSGTAGEIRATNNITAYYSDRRLKENIVVIPNALNKVMQISGVTFNSNDLAATFGYMDRKTQVGVIAQEIKAVLPEVVVPAPFDIMRNADGSECSKSGNDYMTVQYEKIVPLLIEAIKELKAEVDALKNK